MQNTSISTFTLRLADDAMVLSQRLCEWVSNAPVLEEDIALANVALDYLGRARMFYTYAGELQGQTADELAFLRDARAYTNLLMVELPRGDFAFSMVRQYFLDEFNLLFLAELQQSKDQRLADIAAKAIKETRYHLQRSREWMRRLGLGTAESNKRAQAAANELWGYVDELFAMDELESKLCDEGIAVGRKGFEQLWRQSVAGLFEEIDLNLPDIDWQVMGGRQGIHTEHLGHMLTEMQYMQRAYPGQTW